jgi:hypothetical protein
MTDSQKGSLPRQPGCRLPRRGSAELLDLGRERRPGVLPVLPDEHAADGPQARLELLPPLLHLAPGCVPLGQGSIVLDLVSEAEDRDRIPYGDDRGARLQALPAPPEREGGQIGGSGYRQLPRGTRRRDDIYPRWSLHAVVWR